ncbi:MAG: DNA primase, partial [Clostridia bacterium]|nr:DNA primase [Clostridia bacterium]
MINKDTIDEILARTDIESLIGGYVSLKRAGDTYKGLCPFHSEKSPSFTVYPKTASFYCFGCGIGGDAVTFTKQIEHLDYPDALEFLAKRAGITIVDSNSSYEKRENKFDRERMFKMNVDAANFFHKALFSDNPDAREALQYFTEKRGLSVSTIRHFGLGFAPDSFDALLSYMRSRGYSYEELVAGFLCGRSEKGNYYDAFRKRVMFPIIDVAGNVIAFGGRAMDNETKPKYKNSSDTPVYKKTRHVYALNFARHTCGETLILCEGYMDVIALHAAGFTNAIATLGTAITAEQARLMRKYTKKVVICYDSDEAGQKAANKALRVIGDVGLDVRVMVVPGSKDPDEYIKTFG